MLRVSKVALPAICLVVAVVAWPLLAGARNSPLAQAASDAKAASITLDPVESAKAIYPPEARAKNIEGSITVEALVSETGDVENVHVVPGDPLLTGAARDAASKWKFKPATLDGKSTAAVIKISFNFVLSDASQATDGVHGEVGPATALPQLVKLSQKVMDGRIVTRVNPEYPQALRDMRVQGSVVLAARIDKEGKVADVHVISGPKYLVPSSIEAVKKWRYKPYTISGRAVEVDTEIQVNFSLQMTRY